MTTLLAASGVAPTEYAGVVTDSDEHIAALLAACGVAPTEDAIRAALRPPRAPDLERELAIGYLAACAAWERPLGAGAEMLEGEDAVATVRPRRAL